MPTPLSISRLSRRTTFSIALTALFSMTSLPLQAETPATSSQFAYVGTYNPNGEGVYLFKVDGQSGALTRAGIASSQANPAQLTAGQDGT